MWLVLNLSVGPKMPEKTPALEEPYSSGRRDSQLRRVVVLWSEGAEAIIENSWVFWEGLLEMVTSALGPEV
jgi:hypothetical protein